MKRLSLFLLLIGVMIGLAAPQPAQALAAPAGAMEMAAMATSDMASMPDCMSTMDKDASHKPCKCGLAGCIAMMASGGPMMLSDASMVLRVEARSDRDEQIGIFAALRGRSTAPELEPPSTLI
ncbi:hypothetical protein [Sphingomonas sp. PAMC 26621]|uniref:hypothetical protein n=1 Tax=Sphingomonas sp. PAMC 26621 TaxID=1112213 RepID=UPI000288F054|nr:hypothetical protein [Sphingomonas sp. PAMC 26621]